MTEVEAPSPRTRAGNRLIDEPEAIASAFKAVFDHPQADLVLAWFMDACGATETTIDENPFIMAAAEGRRQVWCAMNEILSMTPRDIAQVRNAVASARRAGEDEGRQYA